MLLRRVLPTLSARDFRTHTEHIAGSKKKTTKTAVTSFFDIGASLATMAVCVDNECQTPYDACGIGSEKSRSAKRCAPPQPDPSERRPRARVGHGGLTAQSSRCLRPAKYPNAVPITARSS